jgi:hypothetical protein
VNGGGGACGLYDKAEVAVWTVLSIRGSVRSGLLGDIFLVFDGFFARRSPMHHGDVEVIHVPALRVVSLSKAPCIICDECLFAMNALHWFVRF